MSENREGYCEGCHGCITPCDRPKDKAYSLFRLLDKLYDAKKAYYTSGKNLMSDFEYDRLEWGIIALHGKKTFDMWYRVDYDVCTHRIIKHKARWLNEDAIREWNNRSVKNG